MKQVELSQSELQVLVTILCTVQYKLTDARVVLPLVEKLESFLDPEPATPEALTQPN